MHSSRFSLSDNISPIPRVFSSSHGFTNMILLSHNYSLNKMDFTIENLNIFISHRTTLKRFEGV
jgi:hypothetical protein